MKPWNQGVSVPRYTVTDRGFGDCWITDIEPVRLLWVKRLWADVGVPGRNEVYMHLCEIHGEPNRCANPAHIKVGTRAENALHALALSGAPRFGPGAKLTRDQAAAIRADGRNQYVIAAEYGISQASVSRIKTGKSWR
jgi:hypothetical protein